MKPGTPILASIVCVFMIAACNGPVKDFTERQLIIASEQTVSIKELDLSITNKGCGRKWIAEKDKPAFERPYCELVIKCKDSTFYAGGDYEPVYYGSIQIKVDKMNPWGREEDSIPAGGCRVTVRRMEGR